ncbi:hypothetical protein IWQ56_006114 [Coemansia nantahalensis]|uniref:Uncharacterized protein n=2 Tax=Coemansia TaxID=4863 RepID=A0ACC1KXT1_9FUNG|nr:hypothetical protein IWQ56_006114 [Coemansia nantahalensis]KAJ2769030.1 hypothetical protein IWQ57_003284 [Coemansia nantahalensis]KAJ2796940.1 hypothetical protein H4R21_004520 [Coemansia helicoidea]
MAESAEAGARYQLTQLKEQLAEALGDDGPSYWAALRDFVHGKLNRQEFDFYAYMYLSGETAALHNRFILATIHNAQSGQAPPEGERSAGFEGGRKRRHDGDDRAGSGDEGRKSRRSIKALLEDPKWRYVKELVKSLNKNERRAIKTLLKRPGITPDEAHAAIRSIKPVVLPMPASALPQSYAMDIAKGITAPLVYDTKSTPDIESLSYRMVAIALEKGLSGGVTSDSGQLLLYALDYHLKNIVSNMIYKSRSNRALGIPVSRAVPAPPAPATATAAAAAPAVMAIDRPVAPQRQTTGGLRLRDRLYNSKTTMRLSDLVFSLEISPNTTVEPPLCLERWGNLLVNQVLAEGAAGGGGDDESHIVPSSGDRANALPEGQDDDDDAADHASAAPHVDGDSDDGSKQRRRARRLRARYERWFGPYVAAPHGHGGGTTSD